MQKTKNWKEYLLTYVAVDLLSLLLSIRKVTVRFSAWRPLYRMWFFLVDYIGSRDNDLFSVLHKLYIEFLDFWIVSIILCLENLKFKRFIHWICFRPQERRGRHSDGYEVASTTGQHMF
jgi:hypothetical protein